MRSVVLVFTFMCAALSANAQAPAQTADTTGKPPVSPRRAAFLSLMAPGYGQIRLGRPNTAMLFSLIEVASIGMARKSAMDLAEARMSRKDSVLTSFEPDAQSLNGIKPIYTQSRLAARVKSRRAHYEDWLAAILFNHLFSAADAFVAANLWDLPANVSMSKKEGSTIISASLSFR